MNVSYDWLNEYTDISVPPKDFVHGMNMTGTEIKGCFCPGEEIRNVVVGRILSTARHPNADRLTVCSVDVGEDAPIQIVTAATNIAAGDLVPVAKHKSLLPGGVKITKGKLRGEDSFGMFCSVAELNLTKDDYPDAVEDGILILKEGTVGEDIRDTLKLNDTIFEADIVTNRPDCLCMLGVAREAAATFRSEFRPPEPKVKGEGPAAGNSLTVHIKDTDLCPRYTARVVTDVNIAPSPLWMVHRLRAAGVRAINNIVDITNYVMLEYGQPMHAFDYACLDGSEITVRRAAPGETIRTLDGQERPLTEEMLVIADSKKPVALAGIMGGENSEIKPSTRTVVFESANFFGASVRRTGRALGMRTEASARFEKGLDPRLTQAALDRACELVERLGAGKVSRDQIDEDYSDTVVRTLPLDAEWIARYINADIDAKGMKEILERIGFRVDLAAQTVTVPSFRGDVENKYDISEEIARFYGYDNIPSLTFSADVKSGGLTEEQKFEKKLGIALRGAGLSESITFSFASPKDFDRILLPEKSPLRSCMTISNPIGEDTSLMRSTSLPSMLQVLADNYNDRNAVAHLYEIATVYRKNPDETKLPEEKRIVTLGLYGDGVDFYDLKGRVEEVLECLNIGGWQVRPCKDDPSYHPGRTAELLLNGEPAGVFGQLHPAAAKNYGINGDVFCGELDFEALFRAAGTGRSYRPLPKYPAVTRDLALVCGKDVPAGDIEALIRAAAGPLLENVTVFDVYQGSQLKEGTKSIAWSLTLRDPEKTLQDTDADRTIQAILAALETKGITLRS